MKYEIEYKENKNNKTINHFERFDCSRKELLETLKFMKKDRNIKIESACRVNKKEIYTFIKF